MLNSMKNKLTVSQMVPILQLSTWTSSINITWMFYCSKLSHLTSPQQSIPGTSWRERERTKMFYLTTHSTHFIYCYMASDIWLRTILIVRKETHCRHIGYSYQLTARVLLYAPSHRQDNTYHSLCYTSRGALAGTRNSSVGRPHEESHHERKLYL